MEIPQKLIDYIDSAKLKRIPTNEKNHNSEDETNEALTEDSEIAFFELCQLTACKMQRASFAQRLV